MIGRAMEGNGRTNGYHFTEGHYNKNNWNENFWKGSPLRKLS
jgi:hypothetical protein